MMKRLLFLCGPNGIGKTTICNAILSQLSRSAYVDSDACRMMNPFVLDDETIPTIAKNIADLIENYAACSAVETILFSYGFHGRRREVFAQVMKRVEALDLHFVPFLLCCDEDENLRRMRQDGRSEQRIRTALEQSRRAFDGVGYPTLDITHLTADETAARIIRYLEEDPICDI